MFQIYNNFLFSLKYRLCPKNHKKDQQKIYYGPFLPNLIIILIILTSKHLNIKETQKCKFFFGKINIYSAFFPKNCILIIN